MKKLLLYLLFTANIFAGDTIITTPRPNYLGGGSRVVVKNSIGQTIAKGTTVSRPKYLGGGTVTKLQSGSKTTTIVSVDKPKYQGGGSKASIK